MKKILLAFILAASLSAWAQFRVVNGKVYSLTANEGWTVLDGQYEVMITLGQDMICQPFKVITTSSDTTHGKIHGVGSTSVKNYEGDMVVLRHYGSIYKPGYQFAGPLKGVNVGTTNVAAQGVWGDGVKLDMYGLRVANSGSSYQRQAVIYDMGMPYVPPARPLTPEQIAAKRAASVKAFTNLLAQAEHGEPPAEYAVALRYLAGNGCETNREQAIYWLNRAAKSGYEAAAYKLKSVTNSLP